MKIKLDGGGKVMMKAPMQQWHGSEILQTANFAGQLMMANIDDAERRFDLHYLGYETCGFKTMDDAKAAAPEFANTVFRQLSSLVKTVPESAPATPSL
jgi:hypothetical protein